MALEEAGITMNCSVRTFRDALQAEFPEYAIVLERGFSAATNSCWIRMHARASCKRISGKTASLSTISQRKLEQSQQDYRRLKNG
ncbi:MAG: hypothetical protein K2J62_00600 [Bacteroidales bacterium]|nr:hypothetical protein [Bacteroidales bacterium]